MRPVDLAEQALAGALLDDPERVRTVADWLTAADFNDAQCAAVYEAVRDRVLAGRACTPQTVLEDLRADTDLQWRGGSAAIGPWLHTLVHHCPPDPDAVAYARMVLEASVRRQLDLVGLRVQAAAVDPDGDVAAAVDETLREIEAHGRRWRAATSRIHTVLEEPAHPSAAAGQLLAADRAIRDLAPPDEIDVGGAEHEVIHGVLREPGILRELVPRLEPEDFADPARGNTYRAARTLHELGHRVDVVTIAWEQQRQAVQHGPGLPVEELRQMAAGIAAPGRAEQCAQIVGRAALYRLAEQARASVRQAVRNPGINPVDLLDTATFTYRGVRTAAERTRPAQRLRNRLENAAIAGRPKRREPQMSSPPTPQA
jgi:replicative DNA helicase